MEIVSITVKGDTGAEYTIASTKDEATCTCPAYRFAPHTACKHMRFVFETLVGAPA